MPARLALKTLVGMALITIPASRVALAQGDPLAPSLPATNPWTAAAPYPTTIADYAFAQVGEDLYIISGGVPGAVVNTVRRYNATTDAWTSLADIPVGSDSPAGAFFGGKIYVADGYRGANLLRIYDIATNTWSAGPARPGVFDSFGAAAGAFNGKVYVVGGGIDGPSSVLSIYDIAGNTWNVGPDAPSPFKLGGFTQVGRYLYLIGSFATSGYVNSTVSMRLDMATNTWSTGPVWTPQRAYFALAAVGSTLVAMGGQSNGGGASAQVDELDTRFWPGGAWVPSPDNLPSARKGAGAGFFSTGRVGGEIWNTGGLPEPCCLVFLNEHLFRAQMPPPPSNFISNGGSTILSPGPNGILAPGVTVTVALGVKNIGDPLLCTTAGLAGTLEATGGVTNPRPSLQNYGVICAGDPEVSRSFTFTIDPTRACGATVTASLAMTDGATSYGTLTYTFATGVRGDTWSQNFDALVAPTLPAGWVATNAQGPVPLWVTSTITPDTALNDAFVDDPGLVSDKRLDTPGIFITSASAQVSFRSNYDLESRFDGGVLEVSSPNINGGQFTDITNAAVGGGFVSGGYNTTMSDTFGIPLAGRRAWSGTSFGYINTVANLGPNVAGQTINLRFRMASDTSVASVGWRIDTVSVAEFLCATTLLVTTVADHDDGVCNAADCTLREAINVANARTGSIIGFASGVTGTIQLASALPALSSTFALQGPGASVLTVRRNTGGNYRIFTVNPGAVVSFSGLTIADGGWSGSIAGGIFNDHGTVTLMNCVLTGNIGISGGGIFNRGSTSGLASLTISNSTLSANSASGVFGLGGAIYNEGSNGGTALLNLTNCTLSGNTAVLGAAGIENTGNNGTARATLTNCTLNGNAIQNDNATLILADTILAGSPGANLGNSGSGTIASQGHNLSSDAAGGDSGTTPGGFLAGPGDKRNTNPQFSPAGLANNGGPTKTIALLLNSPAIDAGDDNSAPWTDQRSFSRAGVSDIGAFEFGGCFNACDDGNTCTDDSCVPVSGCIHAANALSCNDGNPCTEGEVCGGGVCSGGSLITAPPETGSLTAAADKATYGWSASASATRYDVVRGEVGALPVGPGGSDEVCFDNLPGTSLVDASAPGAGAGFWYLSRGENACGSGSYGQRSDGSPRITTTCP